MATLLPVPSPEDRLRIMLEKAGLPVRASYRVQEVADLLTIHKSTLYRMMGDGSLPYIQAGATRRVDWASLIYLIGTESE